MLQLIVFVYKQKIANVRNKMTTTQAYRPSGFAQNTNFA